LVLLWEPVTPTRNDGPAPLDASVAAVAALVDPVRRRVFGVVRAAGRPVTRDEVAVAARVSRGLAAFHLDKLVRAGLLRVADTGPEVAGRVGRRPKRYVAGPAEVQVSVPARQHARLAEVLVEALEADGAEAARRAALAAARRRGAALGRAARPAAGAGPGPAGELARAQAALDDLGFEPYRETPAALRLRNCPFQPLAGRSPELVCGINRSLVEGLLAGLDAPAAEAVLAPRQGECCVEVRLRA
jgi:predicted ArsR family transcriptional regulator